jgi:non-heme chloroperoxidase
MQAGLLASRFCAGAFSAAGQIADLEPLGVPAFDLRGGGDRFVPSAGVRLRQADLAPNATLEVYGGVTWRMCATEEDRAKPDLFGRLGSRHALVRHRGAPHAGSLS